MESVSIERLDHLGLLASVIKDLGLIDMLDARLEPDAVESYRLIEHQHDAGKGRPAPTTPITSIDWQIQAQVRPD